MRKVMPSELILNQPLPWSIYDGHGNLLLKAGHVISIAKHINNIVVRGAYTEAPPPKRQAETVDPTDTRRTDPVTSFQPSTHPRGHPLSVFARVDALAMTLERLYTHLQTPALSIRLSTVVRSLANNLMEACSDNTDALLAACHLDRHHPYSLVQQLLSAALTEVTTREMGMEQSMRLSLISAALTRDIALLPVQRQLDQQTDPLDADQIALLHTHPERTVQMLSSMGVDDPLWLDFVLQHHERLDGSGYPRALQDEAISPGARVLAIADAYAVMVTPQPNRLGLQPKEALKVLSDENGPLYDQAILQHAANVLTEYPPGTLIRMANGEVGVIRSRKKFNAQPDLWLIYNQNGMPTMRPKRCDPSEPSYAIADILRVEECRSADVVLKRLWSNN